MSRILIAALLVGFAVVAGARGPSPAPTPTAQTANVRYGWAEVLRVNPVYAPVPSSPPQQCDSGSQANQPSHHTSAALPNAVAGTARGDTHGQDEGSDTAVSPPAGCRPADHYAPQQQIVAYEVEYRYRGEVYMSRLPYDPGERLRVRITVAPAD